MRSRPNLSRVCALTLAAILMLTGCAQDWGSKPTPTSQSGQSNPAVDDWSHGLPWTPGQFEYGVNLYLETPGESPNFTRKAFRALNHISELGANSVALAFPLYTDGVRPSRVYAGSNTPSPAQIETIAKTAKAMGMRVTVRPLIDESNIKSTPEAWRGSIQPPDPEKWFASYRTEIVNYADALARADADELVIASSLSSLEQFTLEWSRIRDEVSARFSGVLSYAYNWYPVDGSVPVDAAGITFYLPVNLPDDASVEQLTTEILNWVESLPENVRSNFRFQEVGIAAVPGGYTSDADWSSTGPFDFQLQANWFEAVIVAATKGDAHGVYFWSISSESDPSQHDPDGDPPISFLGRPAEDVIREFYGGM